MAMRKVLVERRKQRLGIKDSPKKAKGPLQLRSSRKNPRVKRWQKAG